MKPTTPKIAEALDAATEALLVRTLAKVRRGKTLTARELDALRAAARRKGKPAEPAQFAASQSELARMLGVRPALVSYHAKRPGAPAPAAGGLDIAAWRRFLADHGYAITADRAAGLAGAGDAVGAEGSLSKARLSQTLLQNERLQHRITQERAELIPKAMANQIFGRLVAAGRRKCLDVAPRLAELARAGDSDAAATVVRGELVKIWASLAGGNW